MFSLTFSLDEKVSKKSSQKYFPHASQKTTIFTLTAHEPAPAKILFSSFTATLLQFLTGQRTGTLCVYVCG
jgi:hypothetical protein